MAGLQNSIVTNLLYRGQGRERPLVTQGWIRIPRASLAKICHICRVKENSYALRVRKQHLDSDCVLILIPVPVPTLRGGGQTLALTQDVHHRALRCT